MKRVDGEWKQKEHANREVLHALVVSRSCRGARSGVAVLKRLTDEVVSAEESVGFYCLFDLGSFTVARVQRKRLTEKWRYVMFTTTDEPCYCVDS